MNCFKAYIFDLDNTLYDYTACHCNGLRAVMDFLRDTYYADYYGSDFEDYSRRIKNIQGNTSTCHNKLLYFQELAMDNVNITDVARAALDMYDAYIEGFMKECRPYPWVETLLNDLKYQGALLGICTNQTSHMQLNILSHLGISELFDVVITSELAGVEKPDMKIYHEVMSHLTSKNCFIQSADVCYIGDDYFNDYKGPIEFGCSAMDYSNYIRGVVDNEYCGRKIWS